MVELNELTTQTSQRNRHANNSGPMSFISLNEKEEIESKINAKELLHLETSLKEMFLSQLQSKKRKRYTQDGRMCASAFVQDGKTFFDCTSTRSPDGELKNKEWCYVDPGAKGSKIWDYCKPIMDYDKVREANQKYLKEITVACRKTNAEIEQYISPAQNAIDELKRVKDGQAEIDNKVNILIKQISTINNNLANLYSTKTQWATEENKIICKINFNQIWMLKSTKRRKN